MLGIFLLVLHADDIFKCQMFLQQCYPKGLSLVLLLPLPNISTAQYSIY